MALRLRDLQHVGTGAEAVFGGKASGLWRLIAAGARVPPGFAVEATLTPPDQWRDVDRRLVLDRSAELLAGGPVAVRSSAIGEDGTGRSFAGLFDTVLGVTRPEGVLDAAARCIASGSGERVRAYTAGGEALRVGVVVQRQVQARAAGVCFTADPTGTDRAVVLEAVEGAGDAFVSGRAQPEAWRAYRSGLGGWEAIRDRRNPVTVLTTSEAALIASEASALAKLLGGPLDLEWAFDYAGLWWLQARPITAAVPPPEYVIERYHDAVHDGPVTVWANWNVREVMPDPFLPLNWSLWRTVVIPSVVEPLFGVSRSSPLYPHVVVVDVVHGRLYWNMNAMLAAPFLRHMALWGLAAIDARAAQTTKGLIASGILRPRRLPGSRLVLALKVLWASVKSAVGMVRGLRPRQILRSMEACGREIAARGDVVQLANEGLIEEMQLLDAPICDPLRLGQQGMATGMLMFSLAQHAFRRHAEARRLLAAGIAGNPTTAISQGIDDLIREARPLAPRFLEAITVRDLLDRLRSDPAAASWSKHFQEFMARHGQRCPNEFDLGAPRWSEEPTMILELVRAGLRAPRSESVGERLARLGREREAAIEAAALASPLWRRPLLRWLAKGVVAYMPLREAPKHYAMFAFQRMRLAALELGARFVKQGVMDAREDVFFLDGDEVRRLARSAGGEMEYRDRIQRRRAQFERYRSERAPHFLRSDGVPVDEIEPAVRHEGVLEGAGVSGGRVSGPVRILRTPDPKCMSDGDVIVMEFADPGWTPLFPRARAVVMEVGGMMCHAAVVARELGIPGVFGVTEATRRLVEGETVEVDGDRGTVIRRPGLA